MRPPSLRSLDRTRDFTTRSATRLERDLRLKLGDWRRLLRGAVPEARQILRALIQDRIDFTPEVQGSRRLYRYEGTFSVGPLFNGVIDPQALASQSVPTWNHLYGWLQQMDLLRKAA